MLPTKILKFGGESLLRILPRDESSVVRVKNHTKADTKDFLPSPVLLDFFSLFQIFRPVL